jgi:hypothetical protein
MQDQHKVGTLIIVKQTWIFFTQLCCLHVAKSDVPSAKETIAHACKYIITGRSATLQYCIQEGDNPIVELECRRMYSNYGNTP